MAEQSAVTPGLNVPVVEPVEYEHNLIRVAVCELRFPTLLELETEQPVAFQKALRKDYPFYEQGFDLSVEPGGTTSSQRRHTLRSKNREWTVSLRPFSVSLETSAYSNFEQLLSRLERLLAALGGLIDSDFFTRVGLRYIDAIPVGQEGLTGWVNPSLIGALQSGVFGTVDVFREEVRGRCKSGRYTFRHGLAPTEKPPATEYVLDFDLYEESVEANRVLELLRHLHVESFGLFSWAIGDKAKASMGKATKKGNP